MKDNRREQLLNNYKTQAADASALITKLQGYSHLFIAAEILTFLAIVVCIILRTTVIAHNWVLLAALVLFLAYIYIRNRDADNDRRIVHEKAIQRVYNNETAYIEGRFGCFDDGNRYIDPAHPFTFDIDIFGRDSLFQRINRTVTTGGSDELANRLSSLSYDANRANAIDEIAGKADFMTAFKAIGEGEKADSAAVTESLENTQRLVLPRMLRSNAFYAFCIAVIVGFWLSMVASGIGWLSWNVTIWWGVFNLFFCLFTCWQPLKNIQASVGKLQKHIRAYINMVELIGKQSFSAKENQELQQQLSGANESFAHLNGILQTLESRNNVLGLIIFDSLGLWDLRIVHKFWTWRRSYENSIGSWLAVCNKVDALVSMATFRYNEPAAGRATVNDDAKVVYEAKALWHPFLGENAVRNDFNIDNRNYYIITGANMAGKSTFLRSIGINYVLAMNGMPVFAEKMTVSQFHLFTSMRTTDDLTHGISYFNAELNRLSQLIDLTKRNDGPYLIILDEILKGTNSADKLNGSRLFLEYMAEKNVTGVIATHDLELSHMADERPDRFHNYCFEIELGTSVTYSYKITPGVARNQNATFLLKDILK